MKFKMTVEKNGLKLIEMILEGTEEECFMSFYNRNAELLEDLGCDDGHIVATEIDE